MEPDFAITKKRKLNPITSIARSRHVVVSGITPTHHYAEGETVTAIGMSMALNRSKGNLRYVH